MRTEKMSKSKIIVQYFKKLTNEKIQSRNIIRKKIEIFRKASNSEMLVIQKKISIQTEIEQPKHISAKKFKNYYRRSLKKILW